MGECSEPNCERDALVTLHVPWDDDRDVCTAHARVLVQKDGIVAEPNDAAATEWS